jgi:hypothetical protein
MPVILNRKHGFTTPGEIEGHAARARVQGILQELLGCGGWPLNYLARRDLVRDPGVKDADKGA